MMNAFGFTGLGCRIYTENKFYYQIKDWRNLQLWDFDNYKEAKDKFVELSQNNESDLQLIHILDEFYTEEKEYPFLLGTIKKICGWDKFCDVTGINKQSLDITNLGDCRIYNIKETHAKILELF